MEFYSNTRRTPRMRENYTKREQTVYKETTDKETGRRILVPDGSVDVVEKIQEYAEEVKISNILKRYGIQLQQSLRNDEAKMIDLTNIPENLIETMQIIDDAKAMWDTQSKEVKQKFNNDFRQFIAGSENGQIVNMLNEELKTQHEQKKMPSYQDILATMQKQNEMIASLTANQANQQKETKPEGVTE